METIIINPPYIDDGKKYVGLTTKTKQKDIKKIIRKELKYFFLHDYQILPLEGWGLKEYFNYYNEHHKIKVSYEMFLKYFPPLDFLALS